MQIVNAELEAKLKLVSKQLAEASNLLEERELAIRKLTTERDEQKANFEKEINIKFEIEAKLSNELFDLKQKHETLENKLFAEQRKVVAEKSVRDTAVNEIVVQNKELEAQIEKLSAELQLANNEGKLSNEQLGLGNEADDGQQQPQGDQGILFFRFPFIVLSIFVVFF